MCAVLAYFIAAISPNMDVANGALPAYIVINLFFVGLLIRPQDQPKYWHWCAPISSVVRKCLSGTPIRWSLEGVRLLVSPVAAGRGENDRTCAPCMMRINVRKVLTLLSKYSFIHYTPSNPQIRCVAADILWQPSSLPRLGTSSTM